MSNRRQFMSGLAASLILLTGCASTSSPGLQSLGATITPVSVNFGEIQSYAARSRAAYNPEAAIRASYPATVRVNAPGNLATLYFLERDDKNRTQTITVRGTADKKNFSEDLEIKIREDRKLDIPVDSGFDAVAAALYADMKPYLKPGYKTYLTGHSLGGAVAVLVAVYMSEDGHKVERIVTFGQPKFTTAAGVQRLGDLPLIRIVDENDIVPMLPPKSLANVGKGTYEHVGPEVILLEGPDFAYLPLHNAERISVTEGWRSLAFADLKDHKMDNYLRRVSSKVGGAVEVTYNSREQYVAKKTKASVAN